MNLRSLEILFVGLLVFSPASQVWATEEPFATMLWDNGTVDHTHGLSVTGQDLADDFELGAAGDPTSVTMSCWDYDGIGFGTWDGVLRWWIYLDDAGSPGVLLYSGFGRNVLILGDGTPDFYWLTAQFGRSIHMEANTRYWIALHMGSGYDHSLYFSWAASNSSHFSPGSYSNWGTEPWTAWSLDFAFQLNEDTYFNYLFTDGFETGDLSLWSSHSP